MPRPTLDLTGMRFCDLTAKKVVSSTRRGSDWLCECICGETRVVGSYQLRSKSPTNRVKSCVTCAKKSLHEGQERGREVSKARRSNCPKKPLPGYVRQPRQIPLLDNVVAVIAAGARTQEQIIKQTGLYDDELGLALTNLILIQGKVGTRIKGDSREYFVKQVAA